MATNNSENDIRAACEQGDHEAAVQIALRAYGPEILGYLCSRLGDENQAREAYSEFSVDLWRGFERFEWRCSARAWSYTLARNAAHKMLRDGKRRDRGRVPLSRAGELAHKSQTRTPTFLQTPMVREVRALRDKLQPEEQELLALRIDRQMTWPDLAVVLSGGELTGDEEIRKHAARLRQRFVVTKRRLKKLAKEAGLLR